MLIGQCGGVPGSTGGHVQYGSNPPRPIPIHATVRERGWWGLYCRQLPSQPQPIMKADV